MRTSKVEGRGDVLEVGVRICGREGEETGGAGKALKVGGEGLWRGRERRLAWRGGKKKEGGRARDHLVEIGGKR